MLANKEETPQEKRGLLTPQERRARFTVHSRLELMRCYEFHNMVVEFVNARRDPALRRHASFKVREMVHEVIDPLYELSSRQDDESGMRQFEAIKAFDCNNVDLDALLSYCFPGRWKVLRRWIGVRTSEVVRRNMNPSDRIIYDPQPYIIETATLASCMLLERHDLEKLSS